MDVKTLLAAIPPILAVCTVIFAAGGLWMSVGWITKRDAERDARELTMDRRVGQLERQVAFMRGHLSLDEEESN